MDKGNRRISIKQKGISRKVDTRKFYAKKNPGTADAAPGIFISMRFRISD